MPTLKQMLRRTDPSRQDRATHVQILKMKSGRLDTGEGFVAAQTYSKYIVNSKGDIVRNPKNTKYVTTIVFVDRKLNCKVSCSCGDNTFRYEVANSYKNAADIEFSNGAPPTTTNPSFKMGLCKHLIALYLKIQPKLPGGA